MRQRWLLDDRGKKMFKFETHCHTSPVSRCGRATVADTVQRGTLYRSYKTVPKIGSWSGSDQL